MVLQKKKKKEHEFSIKPLQARVGRLERWISPVARHGPGVKGRHRRRVSRSSLVYLVVVRFLSARRVAAVGPPTTVRSARPTVAVVVWAVMPWSAYAWRSETGPETYLLVAPFRSNHKRSAQDRLQIRIIIVISFDSKMCFHPSPTIVLKLSRNSLPACRRYLFISCRYVKRTW